MIFPWDLNTATLLALLTNLVLLVVFAVKTQQRAHQAYERAEEAMKKAEDAHTAASAVNAGLGMLRQHVAENYSDRMALREMEQRLTELISTIGTRVDQLLTRK